jgi:hypothetical protein
MGETMLINKNVFITIFICIFFISLKGVVMAESLIDSKYIVNIVVKESVEKEKIKLIINATLLESSYSVSKVETRIDGELLSIKAYEKYVMFVPKKKLTDQINLELMVPDSVNEIRFWGAAKSIWKRGK